MGALLSGYYWTRTSVTWGDPRSGSAYGMSYDSDGDDDGRHAPYDGFSALSGRQLASVRFILDKDGGGSNARDGFAVDGFTKLGVRYAGSAGHMADIRVANADDVDTAYAYLPGGDGRAGDVWLGGSGRNPRPGNYDHMVITHEVGHALGLDHPHESGMALAHDTPEYTVMTYRAWQGARPTGYAFEQWGAPQTWMMRDIAALQELYGANYSVNDDDTVYRWKPGSGRSWIDGEVGIDPGGRMIFATIWDGGGRDRYDLSAYRDDVWIDLRPGKHSIFGDDQLADLGGGPNGGHARGSIFNALQHGSNRASLIENAVGGSGDDRLIGNAAANRMVAGAGDDTLFGLEGRDTLVGGTGADIFAFRSVADSPAGAPDRIEAGGGSRVAFEGPGRVGGDRIDLSRIDADTTRAGHQSFVFGTSAGTGRIWLAEEDGNTIVYGNVDRDRLPELEIVIVDGRVDWHDYGARDFIL